MKGQGSVSLWMLAIGLIGLFMVATMLAPAMLRPADSGTDDDAGDGAGASQALTFKTPAMTIDPTALDQEEMTNMTVRSSPETGTTGDGGSFAWIISVEGADGEARAVSMYYDDKMVQWFAGPNGALVGIGERFVQGPGASSMEVSTSFSMVPNEAGNYVIKVWIAEAKDIVTLDPTNLKARSPSVSREIRVAEKVEESVTIVQSLSGPTSVQEDRRAQFTLSSEGRATGKWKGSVTELIAISKEGIRSSDVLARVSTDRGFRYISWSDTGDRLVGTLVTSTPFRGTENSETVRWATSFDLEFMTSGDYNIECWSVETGTDSYLSSMVSQEVGVSRPVTPPVTPPAPTNATPAPDTSVVPAPPPAETPVDNTSEVAGEGSDEAADLEDADEQDEGDEMEAGD